MTTTTAGTLKRKSSLWTLELSESFKQNFIRGAKVNVDGKLVLPEVSLVQKVEIPAGLGIHKLEIIAR